MIPADNKKPLVDKPQRQHKTFIYSSGGAAEFET